MVGRQSTTQHASEVEREWRFLLALKHVGQGYFKSPGEKESLAGSLSTEKTNQWSDNDKGKP